MIKNMYVVYDTVAGEYVGGVLVHAHDAAAVRFFRDIAGDPQSYVGRHPNDFELLYIGQVGSDGLIVNPCKVKSVVLTGAALIASQSEPLKVVRDA